MCFIKMIKNIGNRKIAEHDKKNANHKAFNDTAKEAKKNPFINKKSIYQKNLKERLDKAEDNFLIRKEKINKK